MRKVFDPHKDDDIRGHYQNLSQWLNWCPRVFAEIQAMNLPKTMKGAVEGALVMHGDQLLDIFTDELTDAATRAGYRAGLADAPTEGT